MRGFLLNLKNICRHHLSRQSRRPIPRRTRAAGSDGRASHHWQPPLRVRQLAQHVGPPPAQSSAPLALPCLGRLRVLWASCKPGRRAPAFSWSKTWKVDKLTSKISSSWRVTAVFAVRVSSGGPTAAPNVPPASDSAPATPNTVKAFVRPVRFEFLRFEFRLPCDMVEGLPFTDTFPRYAHA